MNLRQALTTDPRDWTAADLAPLRAAELADMCRLMGIPHSGTKPQQIARLLVAADLRGLLTSYDRPAQMTPFFGGATLRALCRRAGVYAGSTKYAMAAALINWRNECRSRGQHYLAECKAEAQRRNDEQPRMF